MKPSSSPGAVVGGVRAVLRIEGLVALAASLVAYSSLRGSWGTFLALFLLPDVSFAAALLGRRAATAAYDAAHTYALPLGIAIVAETTGHRGTLPFMVVWTAHIGFDRAVGYGLKYATGFGDTHLGRVGRAATLESAEP